MSQPEHKVSKHMEESDIMRMPVLDLITGQQTCNKCTLAKGQGLETVSSTLVANEQVENSSHLAFLTCCRPQLRPSSFIIAIACLAC